MISFRGSCIWDNLRAEVSGKSLEAYSQAAFPRRLQLSSSVLGSLRPSPGHDRVAQVALVSPPHGQSARRLG